ncbi:TetR/AcrR family transcriptional regulator [Thermocrispum agreste]|uniref:TetR/AcrR family transcriptional regulator n=1 Tax=Thermocrispum agreste TaxID=37925 RepID=UPI00040DDD10|nr:TetR/AcrR family transcriptional regulator [Thermocrispum agreste]
MRTLNHHTAGRSVPRGHRTQAERSEQTRTALLDATVECLVELGYSRTSVQEICARAGVSKGAQQHHFSTKAELMASAVEHLTHRIATELVVSTDALRRDDPVDAAVEVIRRGFSGRLAAAFIELWVASRTDKELAEAMLPVDRALGRATLETFRELIGRDDSPLVDNLYWMTVNLIRGLAVDESLGGDPARRERLVGQWKQMVRAALADSPGADRDGDPARP